MSYSFQFVESNKAAAKQRIARELAQVIQSQPAHAADCHIHQAAAYAAIDALELDGSITGSMNGSVSTRGIISGVAVVSLSLGINIGLA